jgi:O-antigen/teichoic acid export membrane protein
MDFNFLRIGLFIKGFFTAGHERSIKAKKNIISSFVIQGVSIGISLIMLPITLSYVNASQYGIWLTLSSIVTWFSFFDIGLTQGLRNKFAEARAKNSDSLAQAYVSTTYTILAAIFCFLWLVFIIVNHWLNWSSILRVPGDMRSEVTTLAVIVFSYFCLRFVFRIINTVLTADQKPAVSSLIDLLGQILSLLIILVLIKTTEGSLIKLGIALCASPLLILIIANFFFFNRKYGRFRPQFSKVDLTYAKDLLNLGVVFFVIQVAGIIQFQTANIIIARNFGTADVTSYNVVYRYFGVLNMLSAIFLTPFWSASTEAYLKNDIMWIKNAMKKYNLLNLLLICTGVIMLIFSGTIYRIWLGEGKVNIPYSLSFWGFIYFNVIIFGAKYVSFLNGINALRVQFISCLISPFLYIIVAIILIKYYHSGVYSLFIASVIANFNAYILAPIQYNKLINKKGRGIWIK